MLRRLLLDLGLLLSVGGWSACAQVPSTATAAHSDGPAPWLATCGPVSDVPRPLFEAPPSDPSWRPLRRTHDLLEIYSRGEGEYRSRRTDGRDFRLWAYKLQEGVTMRPLPWHVAKDREDNTRSFHWNPNPEDPLAIANETTLGFLLLDGDAWCTPELTLEPQARLRLDPLQLERAPTKLHIDWESGKESSRLASVAAGKPTTLTADSQLDLPLPAGEGRLCLEVEGGVAAVGEPRLLAPDPGDDQRPRWVILLMLDALRGDALQKESAQTTSPALYALSQKGYRYQNAVSNGCHTRASVWPLMMGRDLMRVDPLMRRESFPIQSPITRLYSRGNLFITQLAENAGYHSVFVGNNEYFAMIPAFSRFSSQGKLAFGTYDSVYRIPALMERYRDERVFLLYYISNPHSRAATPMRLVKEFGCEALDGFEQCRCAYDARLRHADESVEALQRALDHYGLTEQSLQIVTSDHGEVLEDGIPMEKATPGQGDTVTWSPLDYGHGGTCHWNELHIPLLVSGPGISPRDIDERVSSLDIVPTLADLLNLPVASHMDGRRLPFLGSPEPGPRSSAERRFVSYGFCSDSSLQGSKQLIWWTEGCPLRLRGTDDLIDHRSELWMNDVRVATDVSGPDLLGPEMAAHEDYIRSHLAGSSWIFDLADLPPARLRVNLDEGSITDYGPSGAIYGISGIQAVELDASGRALVVELDGYQGQFFVTTWPREARIRIELETLDGTKPLTLAGAMQLPIDLLDRWLDPNRDRAALVSDSIPLRRGGPSVQLRVWRDSFGSGAPKIDASSFSDFERALRNWGYIR